MTTHLGPLYHWSPRKVRKQIDRLGLMPSRKPASLLLTNEGDGFRQPMICLGTSPATAWAYSNGVWGIPGTWDLWEVALLPEDEVHPMPLFGNRLVEIRVANRLHKRRLTWVGERTTP